MMCISTYANFSSYGLDKYCMKNILILASCQRENLESGLWSAMKDTWAEIIVKRKFPGQNIRFYGYCAMSDDERSQSPHDTLGYIGAEERIVLCP